MRNRAHLLGLGCLVLACAGTVDPPPRERNPVATQPAKPPAASKPADPAKRGKIVDFGHGIRINYPGNQVEVDAEVILREGPLELFAYARAPTPKEHESILLLKSPPERIYEALGLVGANPGVPLRYFPETEKVRPASGDPIDVLVRLDEKGKQRTVPACDWMLDLNTKKTMPRTHWLFTGSERYEDGTFAAKIDGTVVTVVDFTSSVLGLPTRHSDADAELWLVANTDAIPPVGTKCVLLLRPVSLQIAIALDARGTVDFNGRRIGVADLPGTLASYTAGWADRASVRLTIAAGAPADVVRAVREALKKTGVPDASIQQFPGK